MSTETTIIKVLKRFAMNFKGFHTFGKNEESDRELIEHWHMLLGDVPDDILESATVHICRTWSSEFNRSPVPGDVIQFWNQATEASWADAWQEVQALSQACVQPDSTVEFSSPEIRQACQSVGGLRAVFECETDMLPTIRAQFRDALKTIRAQNQARNIVQRVTTPRVELPGMDGKTIIQLKPGQADISDEIQRTIKVLPEPEDGNWHAYAKVQREHAPVVDFAKLMARRAQ